MSAGPESHRLRLQLVLAQGKVVIKATVATEEKVIVSLVRSAGPRVHVAFEEGTHAQWLHDLLLGHAERVVVCNMRGRDALRNANGRIDADEMSKRLHDGSLRPVFHCAEDTVREKLHFRRGNDPLPRRGPQLRRAQQRVTRDW